jgi:PTS system mannose-specific IIC component
MEWVLLVVWGALVGLDLVSGPQVMIARPLVAGTVAGALVGDVVTGAAVGAVLELYALDVLPVGATRYPDFGPGAVAAAVLAAGAPLALGLGPAVGLGLVVAWIGGGTMHILRRANARRARRIAARLEDGDGPALRRLHRFGFLADAVRSTALTAGGLGAAALLRLAPPPPSRFTLYAGVVVVSIGLATAGVGALRLTGTSAARWLAAGAVVGVALVVCS